MSDLVTIVDAAMDMPVASQSMRVESTMSMEGAPVGSKIPSTTVASSQQNKSSKSADAVVSILDGIYARPPNRTSQTLAQPKPLFLHRKLNPLPEGVVHFGKPPQAMLLDNREDISSARVRALSEGSVQTQPAVQETLQKTRTRGSDESQPSTSSLAHSEVTGRVVGRGGRGSRLRTVASKQDVVPIVVSQETHPSSDGQPVPLRVSGRGGWASRPKHLSPAPSSKSTDVKASLPTSNLSAPSNQPDTKAFIRPSGRGGAGSRPGGSVSSPLTLRRIISKTKRKNSDATLPQNRVLSAFAHPISPETAHDITNRTSGDSSLSSIHFAGESSSPPPIFFPEPVDDCFEECEDGPLEEDSMTTPFSESASTSEISASLNSTGEEEIDIDVYLEEEPNPRPTVQRNHSLTKLMRTFGANPYDPNAVGLAPISEPTTKPLPPAGRQQPLNAKTTKAFRRSSLSMTSILSRTLRKQRSTGLDSQETITTITDDLHQLGIEDDAMSESWGYHDASRLSASEPPGSPIIFSPPSPPPPQVPTLPRAGNDAAEGSVPISTLDIEPQEPKQVIYTGTQHARGLSLSSSLSEIAFADSRSNVIPPADWLFPPSESEHDFKVSISRNLSDKPMAWTGEWNTDIGGVINALRHLR